MTFVHWWLFLFFCFRLCAFFADQSTIYQRYLLVFYIFKINLQAFETNEKCPLQQRVTSAHIGWMLLQKRATLFSGKLCFQLKNVYLFPRFSFEKWPIFSIFEAKSRHFDSWVQHFGLKMAKFLHFGWIFVKNMHFLNRNGTRIDNFP